MKKTNCAHAYSMCLSPTTRLCSACGEILEPRDKSAGDAELIMPPHIFKITAANWKQYNPWPLIKYGIAKRFGWYVTLFNAVQYLVMPIVDKYKMPISYSARKLEYRMGGLKYVVPKGRAKRMWISDSSVALLGSYGDLDALVQLSPRYIAEGVADAAHLSQLDPPKYFTVVMDGDAPGVKAAFDIVQQLRKRGYVETQVVMLPPGKDPTDIPIGQLKRLIAQQTRR